MNKKLRRSYFQNGNEKMYGCYVNKDGETVCATCGSTDDNHIDAIVDSITKIIAFCHCGRCGANIRLEEEIK